MKKTIREALNKESLTSFFGGYLYPPAVALVTLVGAISGLSIYACIINISLLITALLLGDSIKPLIINLTAFVYQISLDKSPFFPNYSNYFFTGWRVVTLSLLAIGLVFALGYYVIKNKLYSDISLKRTPLLLPLLVFSLALLLNGAFSGVWTFKNLVYALAQIIAHLFVFLLFYQGLKKEKTEELGKYFAYVSALLSLIIISELVFLFATGDNIFIDGSINKVAVSLGWGIWNLIGISLTVLIPMIFYGMEKNKYPWFYFALATLTWIFAVSTMSRNALIFASLSYASCILIFSFKGKHKKALRIVSLLGLAFVLAIAVVFFDKIYSLFRDFFERGFSDNGRFALWSAALQAFKSAPVFGKGFYGTALITDAFGALPESAHNTVLQLLSASGVVGFLAYTYFRFKSVIPFVKKPSVLKTLLGISILSLLFGSMLDNFVFDIYPTFYTSIALAITLISLKEE